MTSFVIGKYITPIIILLVFSLIFIGRSVNTMINVPFYEFDEAHRAENAKKMKEYGSFLVPLTGSPFDRVEHLKIPLKENSDLYLYYHLERPPLVYDLMILSSLVFGNTEFAYRLPSFILGISTIVVLIFFAKILRPNFNYLALITAVLIILTSSDLWLSSQYAQLDTSITFFLFLGLLNLLAFLESRKNLFIYLCGISVALAVLSKGQPAVIFIFPLIYLILTKKLLWKDLLRFIVGSLVILAPWLTYLIMRFGIKDVITIIPGFALSSASILYIHHKAPFFWYVRWWWESLRPGLTIFLAVLIHEIFSKTLDLQKKIILVYIFCSLVTFSIPINKIWWYVLPLIPVIALYIFLALDDYLSDKNLQKILNVSLIVIIGSLPVFLKTTSTITLIYGIVITCISFFILRSIFTLKNKLNPINTTIFFGIALFIALIFFLLSFPEIRPYHINTKEVALYYRNLPGKKCLWIDSMPLESALFYSEAGVINLYNKNSGIFYSCSNNYLVAPRDIENEQLLTRKGNIRLYKLSLPN